MCGGKGHLKSNFRWQLRLLNFRCLPMKDFNVESKPMDIWCHPQENSIGPRKPNPIEFSVVG